MKKIGYIFLILFLCMPCHAEEAIYSAADGVSADSLAGIETIFEGFSFREAAVSLGKGTNTGFLTTLWNGLCNFIRGEATVALGAPLGVAALAITSGLIGNLRLSPNGTGEAVFFLLYAVTAGLMVSAADSAAEISRRAAEDMGIFTAAAIPSLATLAASSGGTFLAAVHPMLLAAMSGASLLVSRVGIPSMYLVMALGIVGNLSEQLPLSTLAAFIRKTALWLIGGSFTLYAAVLTVSGFAAGTLDGVTLKGVKYAASTLVPLLGGFLSEAAEAVSFGALTVKNAAGAAGMFFLILLTLYPVVKILVISLLYRLAAAVTEPVSDKRITASLTTMADALSGIGAMTAALGALSVIVLGLMVRSVGVGVT